jgi:peptide/nickel transport system ATP-binding protein/oligopeptide transport system ATP-binding protein
LQGLSKTEMNKLRGKEITMIFQDPTAVLNPVLRVGDQIVEPMLEHGVARTQVEAQGRAVDLMRRVGIPAPERRLRDYPHQFSGGMCQRVVIATALACDPRMILADEPTTALDVTIQDQILKLLVNLQESLGLSLILVTHDMGVVAQTCQRVAVMYAGQIVEMAETRRLFAGPRHPYTVGLLNCVPRVGENGAVKPLRPIPGSPPDLVRPPSGCRFHPRCPLASEECRSGEFPLTEIEPGRFTACIKHEQLARSTDIWSLLTAEEMIVEEATL